MVDRWVGHLSTMLSNLGGQGDTWGLRCMADTTTGMSTKMRRALGFALGAIRSTMRHLDVTTMDHLVIKHMIVTAHFGMSIGDHNKIGSLGGPIVMWPLILHLRVFRLADLSATKKTTYCLRIFILVDLSPNVWK